jgi:hypothetical protein
VESNLICNHSIPLLALRWTYSHQDAEADAMDTSEICGEQDLGIGLDNPYGG